MIRLYEHTSPSTSNCGLQGTAAAEAQDWATAEAAYVKARQPAAALHMYKAAGLWEQALRIAEDFLPAQVLQVTTKYHQC